MEPVPEMQVAFLFLFVPCCTLHWSQSVWRQKSQRCLQAKMIVGACPFYSQIYPQLIFRTSSRCFQTHVESPIMLIQSGMSPIGPLHAFSMGHTPRANNSHLSHHWHTDQTLYSTLSPGHTPRTVDSHFLTTVPSPWAMAPTTNNSHH